MSNLFVMHLCVFLMEPMFLKVHKGNLPWLVFKATMVLVLKGKTSSHDNLL